MTRRGLAPAPAAGIDVLLVVAFATIGRRNHAEGVTLLGVAGTAAPFLVGLAVGWVVARAWRAPTAVWPVAVTVWATTVVVAMLLRAATGAGTAPSFVAVATVFLAAVLLGWRLLAAMVRGRRT